MMNVEVLFARIPVRNFGTARDWYERFFDRVPDVVAHENEVMWQVTDRGWLYIVGDAPRAGSTTVAMAVSDLRTVTAGLEARNVTTGPVQEEGTAGWKIVAYDPDGNSIEIIEVADQD